MAWLAAPLELGVVVFTIRRIRRFPRSVDVLEQFRSLCLQLIRNRIAAGLVAAELAIVYYAFMPRKQQDAGALPYRESTAASQFAPVIFFVLAIETVGLHLMLHRWSPTAAWVATALDLYGLVFLTGFYRSLLARPHLLTPQTLTLRMGLLSELRIERAEIAAWSRPGALVNRKAPGTWRMLTLGDGPQFLLEFNKPLRAVHLYSFTRQVTRAAVSIDDPRKLAEWLTPPVSS